MSWFKFWKSSKRDDKKARSDLVRSESFKEDSNPQTEAEKEKNRLRHSMSISRSGRFKQKNKQRSGILDKEEFINGTGSIDSQKENNNVANATPTNFEQKRTPPSTCREVSARQPITTRHFEGHTTVL